VVRISNSIALPEASILRMKMLLNHPEHHKEDKIITLAPPTLKNTTMN
jgi:hypothetical protein